MSGEIIEVTVSDPIIEVVHVTVSDPVIEVIEVTVNNLRGPTGPAGGGGGGGGDGIGSLVEDTSPQLGGNLDLNSHVITGLVIGTNVQAYSAHLAALASAANSTVLAATTSSFLSADKTKLNGIETGADVTDATNVDAAGAVMLADATTAGMGFVVDEDNMTSNSATKVPTQQSVKAFVEGKGYLTEVEVSDIDASGSPSGTTFLRGDGAWATPAGGGGGISSVADDATPQLGGDLDLNGHVITGLVIGTNVQAYDADLSALASAGNSAVLAATTSSFLSADKTKLNGIETAADVTDTANVTTAGALMDSEVTSLSGIKSLTVPDSTTISAFGKTLVDDADAAAARTTLGLGNAAGLTVDADIATLSLPASTTISAFGATLIDDAAAVNARTTLGVDAAGTDNSPTASATVPGKVELATTAETTTGTDATRAVTPDGLHDMTSLAGAAWFLDQDNMSSDSATQVASQQSIKAYVDTTVAAAITALKAQVYVVNNHGATAGTARITGFAGNIWVGSVAPSNATGVDFTVRTDEAV